MKILPRSFYNRETVTVARELLGNILVRRLKDKVFYGMISETEAYKIDDPACHAHRGETPRTKALFGTVGHTYVYLCYGIHYCMNIVSRATKECMAGGVLIRGVIPLYEGKPIKNIPINHLIKKLGLPENIMPTKILNGPGVVAKMLAIDRTHAHIDVTNPLSEIYIIKGPKIDDALIAVTRRIGISVAQELPWRFHLVTKKGDALRNQKK